MYPNIRFGSTAAVHPRNEVTKGSNLFGHEYLAMYKTLISNEGVKPI